MAEVDNSRVVGAFEVRPSGYAEDEQLWTLQQYDKALGTAGHDRMHYRPASFFVIDLAIFTAVPDGGSGNSCRIAAPFPLTIWAIDLGCESAGGATGVLDVFADDGTSDVSILDAAEDVKTGAGTSQRVAPEDGSEDIAYGTELYLVGTSGAGGTIVGAQAHLYCQRL